MTALRKVVSSPHKYPRFPYGFAVASVSGVAGGFIDRGLGPFESPSSAWAALVICAGATLAACVCGTSRISRLRLVFPFVFFAVLLAALTSAYGLLDHDPGVLAIASLVGMAMVPFAYVSGLLEWRKPFRAEEKEPTEDHPTSWAGIVGYLLFTLLFSWVPVFVFSGLDGHAELPTELRLLLVSTAYALLMGWQPLVAIYLVKRWIDPNIPPAFLALPNYRYFLLAIVAPFAVAGIAVAIALTMGLAESSLAFPPVSTPHSFDEFNLTVATICAALSLLWVQALVEEVGWRGYFLESLMDKLGAVGGLVIHGMFWGLWYAPLFLAASGSSTAVGSSGLTFVVTCMLLGSLLGWLKLASKSVLSPATANVVLTVCAGLPLLLSGDDPGIRGSVYGPAGWIPMAVVLGVILMTGLRSPINIRNSRHKGSQQRWLFVPVIVDEDAPDRDDEGSTEDDRLH